MTGMLRLAAVLAFGFTALVFTARAGPARAEGHLDIVATFTNGDTEIKVATYGAPNDQGAEERIGLVGITIGEQKNSVAFSPNEWPALIRLWRRARDAQSDTWRPVGDFTETGTSDVSHLAVSAGPGMRLVLESPAKGAMTADLARSDLVAFGAALDKVTAYLAEDAAPAGPSNPPH